MIVAKRLQNRIAESRISLPVTAVYAVTVCIMYGFIEKEMWVQFCIFAISSYLMVELNNSNSLIRIYSRMVSCSYMMLFLTANFLLFSIEKSVVQLFFIAFYLFFFSAYQDGRAVGKIFYAFFMLGAASTQFVQILYYVPLVWFFLFTNIQAATFKTVFSSFLGLVLPYWFFAGYYVYTGKIADLSNHFASLAEFGSAFNIESLDIHRIVLFAVLSLFSILGIVHFHRNSYKDKIRTRMMFEIFMFIDLLTIVFIVLQPQHFDMLFGIMLVNTAPIIAHYIALTRTWITNISFCVFFSIVILLTAYNIWMD